MTAADKTLEAALANLREAWSALAMIREAVETLAPSGSVKAADGPTFMHEAEALVAGIMAIASQQSLGVAQPTPDDRRATEDMTLATNVRNAVIEECARITSAPFGLAYTTQRNKEVARDVADQIGRAIRALAAQPPAAPVEVDPASTFTDEEWHDALMGDPHPRSSAAAPVDADAMQVYDHAHLLVRSKGGTMRQAEIAGVHAAITAAYDVMVLPPRLSAASEDEYQPRTPERVVELLRSFGYNPRSWQSEAADLIERLSAAPQPSADNVRKAFDGLFPDYRQAGFTGGMRADYDIVRAAITSTEPQGARK